MFNSFNTLIFSETIFMLVFYMMFVCIIIHQQTLHSVTFYAEIQTISTEIEHASLLSDAIHFSYEQKSSSLFPILRLLRINNKLSLSLEKIIAEPKMLEALNLAGIYMQMLERRNNYEWNAVLTQQCKALTANFFRIAAYHLLGFKNQFTQQTIEVMLSTHIPLCSMFNHWYASIIRTILNNINIPEIAIFLNEIFRNKHVENQAKLFFEVSKVSRQKYAEIYYRLIEEFNVQTSLLSAADPEYYSRLTLHTNAYRNETIYHYNTMIIDLYNNHLLRDMFSIIQECSTETIEQTLQAMFNDGLNEIKNYEKTETFLTSFSIQN